MRRRGNIAVIDGVAALIVVLVLYIAVGYYGSNSNQGTLQQGISKETMRLQFYNILFSGGILNLTEGKSSSVVTGGLVICTEPPSNGQFLNFFISINGGIREFYVYEEG